MEIYPVVCMTYAYISWKNTYPSGIPPHPPPPPHAPPRPLCGGPQHGVVVGGGGESLIGIFPYWT